MKNQHFFVGAHCDAAIGQPSSYQAGELLCGGSQLTGGQGEGQQWGNPHWLGA